MELAVAEIERPRDRKFLALCAAAALLALFLHFFRLGEVPNGFFYDESGIAYNAYCINQTGADEYGKTFPVFFRGFDNYHDPVMVYVLSPLVGIFGLEKWIVRLPSAVFHLLACAAFGFLAFHYTRNRWHSLAAAFLLSVIPWVFPVSRITLAGYTPMLLGIICGWLFTLEAVGRKSAKFASLAAIGWAFAMYSHNCGRPVTAVLLACLLIWFNRNLLRRARVLVILFAVLAVLLVPMMITSIREPAALTSRFREISLYHNSQGPADFAVGLLQRLVEYFSPGFLFLFGDPDQRHNAGDAGVMFIFTVPLVLCGIFRIIRYRHNPLYGFLLLGLLTYPVAAVLTKDHMHSTRCINGAPFWCLTAILGCQFLVWRMRHGGKYFRPACVVLASFAFVEISSYFMVYFNAYPPLSRASFNAPLVEAIEKSFGELRPGETLYVSASTFHHPVGKDFKPVWYSHFLFFGKVPPDAYQKGGIPEDYITPYLDRIASDGILLRMNSTIAFGKDGPVVVPNQEKIPEGSVLLDRIVLKEGTGRYFEIYRVKGEKHNVGAGGVRP